MLLSSLDRGARTLNPTLFSDCAPGPDPRSRPWRSFWPPDGDARPAAWSKSEFPSVASWRFDPGLPFERPWRFWTRTQQARKETANVSPENSAEDAGDAPEVRTGSEMEPREDQCCASGEAARHLDAAIEQRSLSTVSVASFSYLSGKERYDNEKPYLSRLPSLPGFVRTNIAGGTRSVRVHEITGHEDLFTLDKSGFEFAKWKHTLGTWNNTAVASTYLPALALWLQDHLECSEVHIYAYNFRSNAPSGANQGSWKSPFFRAHCDATAASCARRLQLYLPNHKSQDPRRVRFLNVWRALTTPFQDSPLALCDHRTVAPGDLVAADIIFPHYLDEAYEVRYNANQRWFYKQGMTDEDVIVFKLSDTADSVAQTCPHSAFMDPTVPTDTPERASIEVRAIVIG